MLGCGRIGGLAYEPIVVGTACHKCSNRACFNIVTRSLDANALYIKRKSGLREKELEEYGC